MSDGFTWLRQPETGGVFRCPDAAVEDWCKDRGWEPCEPPEEVNPAVAERITAEREQAAPSPTQEPAAEAAQTTTRAARRGESQE